MPSRSSFPASVRTRGGQRSKSSVGRTPLRCSSESPPLPQQQRWTEVKFLCWEDGCDESPSPPLAKQQFAPEVGVSREDSSSAWWWQSLPSPGCVKGKPLRNGDSPSPPPAAVRTRGGRVKGKTPLWHGGDSSSSPPRSSRDGSSSPARSAVSDTVCPACNTNRNKEWIACDTWYHLGCLKCCMLKSIVLLGFVQSVNHCASMSYGFMVTCPIYQRVSCTFAESTIL